MNRSSLYLEDMALQNSNYEQNGLLGAFTINLLSGGIARPAGYYPGMGAEILARYPMENFDRIAAEPGVSSGKFYTTGFGGGTARPEFELLTGLTTDGLPGGAVPYQYIKSDFPCHVRDLKEEGYRCIGLHQ